MCESILVRTKADFDGVVERILENDPTCQNIRFELNNDIKTEKITSVDFEILAGLAESHEISHIHTLSFASSTSTIDLTNAVDEFAARIIRCNLPCLQTLSFERVKCDAITEALSVNSNVKSLKIKRCIVCMEGMVKLFRVVFWDENTIKLNSGKRSTSAIAKTLKSTHCAIENLDLSHNKILDWGCTTIVNELICKHSIKRLNLSNCGIRSSGTLAIAKALRSAQCAIEILDLSQNTICNEGSVRIANSLMRNSKIKYLNLSHCAISKEGVIAISETLRSGVCSVEELDISGNIICGDSCVTIMNSLVHNRSVQTLDLSSCAGNNHIKSFANVLRSNQVPFLKDLSLCWNIDNGAEGFEILADALSHNSTLTRLDLTECQACAKGCTAMMNALCVNSSLQFLGWDCTTFIMKLPSQLPTSSNATLAR